MGALSGTHEDHALGSPVLPKLSLPPCSCRLLAYLNWEPEHRAAVLTMPQHLPDPAARASAYRQALRGVPLHSAEAVNDAVAWVLRRTRNERGEVREQVSVWQMAATFWRTAVAAAAEVLCFWLPACWPANLDSPSHAFPSRPAHHVGLPVFPGAGVAAVRALRLPLLELEAGLHPGLCAAAPTQP